MSNECSDARRICLEPWTTERGKKELEMETGLEAATSLQLLN